MNFSAEIVVFPQEKKCLKTVGAFYMPQFSFMKN